MRAFVLTLLFTFIFPLISSAALLDIDPIEKYANGKPVEILIVPGHDDKSPGAVFRGMREADMSLILAQKLAKELSSDPQIFVTVTRDANGYIAPLQKYFDDNKKEINDFIAKSKKDTQDFLDENNISIISGVTHNNASSVVAYDLYGINKWIAEESFDFVIHIHFNDDTSHWGNNFGEYSGYTVYAPDKNLPNSLKAEPLAENVARELQKTFWKSNLPVESTKADSLGIVPDFKLISLGSNMSLKTPSILVEYSYIYEPNLAKDFFDLSSSVMARATARGIFNMLSGPQDWHSLNYSWKKPLGVSIKKDPDTLALQYGLKELGFFPPKNLNRAECGFTGIFGPCTQKALKEFQRKNNLTPDGVAGPKTEQALNSIFGF